LLLGFNQQFLTGFKLSIGLPFLERWKFFQTDLVKGVISKKEAGAENLLILTTRVLIGWHIFLTAVL